ncbi:MAG: hypothetical protein AAGI15_07560 [Pseudomonadota bacterium]
MSLRRELEIGLLACALAWFGHWVNGSENLPGVALGLALLLTIALLGYLCARLAATAFPDFSRRLPDIFWVSTVAVLVGLPIHPLAETLYALCEPVQFSAVLTPIMALAAIGISAQEAQRFKATGLQMLLIATLVFSGTFLGSALIAQLLLPA